MYEHGVHDVNHLFLMQSLKTYCCGEMLNLTSVDGVGGEEGSFEPPHLQLQGEDGSAVALIGQTFDLKIFLTTEK